MSATLDGIPSPPDRCQNCGHSSFYPRMLPLSNSDDYSFAYHECEKCGTRHQTQALSRFASDEHSVPTWQEIFGHPEPYTHQKQGITSVINTAREGGYVVMEGGCGTGKTMIALTAAAQLIRDPRSSYQQALVLTSVKQQLQQFQDDLRIINRNLPKSISPFRGLTLVGKGDLCPYSREEVTGISTDNITGECRQLRENTSNILSRFDGDGLELSKAARIDETDEPTWTTSDAEMLYPETVPQVRNSRYCPFYALSSYTGEISFGKLTLNNPVLDTDSIVQIAAGQGLCPHTTMTSLIPSADIVIANYYHAFDYNTRRITQSLLDDSTFVICDEAHMIEARVRNVLSSSVDLYMIYQATKELQSVITVYTDSGRPSVKVPEYPRVVEALNEQALNERALKTALSLVETFNNALDKRVRSELRSHDQFNNWRHAFKAVDRPIDIPFRNPEYTDTDSITKFVSNQYDIDDTLLTLLSDVSRAIDNLYSSLDGVNAATPQVLDLLYEWFARDNSTYLRQVSLDPKDNSNPSQWQQAFDVTVEINNVMPQAVISNTLKTFGGGLLMSATLEPIDVYREVTGLEHLSTFEDTPVSERVYTADFPQDNRESYIVDLPKFTYSNRGSITDVNNVRKQYARLIYIVARLTPGNVLVCMPSYTEAKWASSVLKSHDDVQKEVLLDESSDEKATEQMKQYFFQGDPKVLVTSLRGTLTEGVDYDGDKLKSCVVCGLAIENTGSPVTTAVKTAYQDQFGGAGFDYGLTVPAVRKTRQALGRVIRGKDDVGIRVLADGRYVPSNSGTASNYLSDKEQEEYTVVQSLDRLERYVHLFWQNRTQ